MPYTFSEERYEIRFGLISLFMPEVAVLEKLTYSLAHRVGCISIFYRLTLDQPRTL